MALRVREELKKLETMQAKMEAELAALQVKQAQLKAECGLKKMALNDIKQKMRSLQQKNKEILVSEHAILRYFERVEGMDIEEIAKRILPDKLAEMIEVLGNGHYPSESGAFKVVVKNRTVVTVLVADEKSAG